MKPIILPSDYKRLLMQNISGGYLFFGPENYLASHYTRETRKVVAGGMVDADFSCRIIDAPLLENPLGEIYDALTTLSGFGGKRLVEVVGLDIDHMKTADFEKLVELCELCDESAVMILRAPPDTLDVGYLPKRPSAKFAALAEVLCPVSFDYEQPARLMKWIQSHFASLTVACEPNICKAMIDGCGRDMSLLSGEIEKLAAYVLAQGRRSVTPEDVDLICVKSSESGAFDFANAITDGDITRALELMAEFRAKKEKPEIILATISRTLGDILTVATLAESGMKRDEIARRTKLHEFKVGNYLTRLSKVSPRYAHNAMKRCLECDRKLKSTALDGYSLIERMILTL